MYCIRTSFYALVAVVLIVSCRPAEKALPDYFSLLPLADTLHFAIVEDEASVEADTLSYTQFFGALTPEVIANMEYMADSSASVVLARGRYVLDARYEVIWVDIRLFWFQHQALLLYDNTEKRITDRITVAEWYGGEGGQILQGAWLLDWNDDGNKELIQRQASHSIRLEGDEMIEHTDQYVSMWQLRDGRFVEIPIQDSAQLKQAYKLPDMW